MHATSANSKLLALAAALFFSFAARAQQLDTVLWANPTGHQKVQVSYYNSIVGNGPSVGFLWGFGTSRFLEEGLKQRGLNSLRDRNATVVQWQMQGAYVFRADSAVVSRLQSGRHAGQWILRAGAGQSAGASFSRDAFQLWFMGNQDMHGQTVDLNNAGARQLATGNAGVARIGQWTTQNGTRMSYMVGVDVLMSKTYTHIGIESGTFHTSPTADSIALVTRGVVLEKANEGAQATMIGGMGLGLNAAFQLQRESGVRLGAWINGMGFMHFFAPFTYQTHFNMDIRWTGVDLTQPDDFQQPGLLMDSIERTLLVHRREGPFTRAMPFNYGGYYHAPVADRWSANAALWGHSWQQLPSLEARMHYDLHRNWMRFPNKWIVGAGVWTAGMSRPGSSLALSWQSRGKLGAALQINSAEALLMPNTTSDMLVNARVNWDFRSRSARWRRHIHPIF